jgi:integrase
VAGSRWSDSGHIFATMHGKPLHAATITRALDDALARAELPHTRFHDLRHSAATFLLSQGFGLEDVRTSWGTAPSC